MYAKIVILLIGACCCAATLPPHLGANVKLLELMSRQMAMGKSATSMECFQYYIPILNDITAKYEKDYAICDSTATKQRNVVDNNTRQSRYEIDSSADEACNRLKACRSMENIVDYFDCHAKVGSDNSMEMYRISKNASDVLTDVNEQFRVIDINENSCKKTAERNYVENTASTNTDLNKCLGY